MKLHRLVLTNYRGITHREIEFPDRGVVVVCGANEVGKSSMIEALDLLLESRDRSTKKEVKQVKPTNSDVGSEVTAEISCGAYRFVYRKRFHKKCETELTVLTPRREQLTGDEAHERVRAMLAETVDNDLWHAQRVLQATSTAAVDLSGEDALAGVMPDIGIEQSARRAPPCPNLGDPRQRCHNCFNTGDLCIGETIRLPGRAGDQVNGIIGKEQRQSHIIGHAFGTELLENREIHRAIRIGEPPAECSAGRVDASDRVFPELRRIEEPEPPFRNFDVGARPPYEAAPDDLRMQDVYKHGDPPQRNAASDEPLAQLGQYVLRQRRRSRAVYQPISNRSYVRRRHRG